MTFIKTLLKWLLLSGLIVFVFFVALGIYLEQSGEMDKFLFDSPIIREFEAIEQSGDYNRLADHMISRVGGVSEKDAQTIVRWLDKRKDHGAAPYLYLRALYLGKAGRTNDSFEAYELAKLAARLDEIRCNREVSAESKMKYEGGYLFPFELAVSKRDEAQQKADRAWAHNYEQQLKDRPLAQWVCTNNYTSEYDLAWALPDNEWQKKRGDYLHRYLTDALH